MNSSLYETTKQFFKSVEDKDLDAVLAYFSNDAELIDPHYPNAHMKGKKAITEGLIWGFKSLKKFGFTLKNYFESDHSMSAAVEVATSHELPNGKELNFPQVFIIEFDDGQIKRLQAYEPYGPNGIHGLILNIMRLTRKITGRRG